MERPFRRHFVIFLIILPKRMEMMGWAMSGTNIKLIREADGIGDE
jgi:hypothetical protein